MRNPEKNCARRADSFSPVRSTGEKKRSVWVCVGLWLMKLFLIEGYNRI